MPRFTLLHYLCITDNTKSNYCDKKNTYCAYRGNGSNDNGTECHIQNTGERRT